MKCTFKNGFVLPMAIILLFVASVVIAAVLSYAAFTTRITDIHLGNTICRLAAQSAIEEAKINIQSNFSNYAVSSANQQIDLLTGRTFSRWFGNPTSKSTELGVSDETGDYRARLVKSNIRMDHRTCEVTPFIPPNGVEYDNDDKRSATLKIRAEARCTNPTGTESSSIIEERVRFAVEHSGVFDNAYFVNNYGWFQGSAITANGDVRANGNLYLDSGCTVNGCAYGARNQELGVIGSIQNTGKKQDRNTYWNNCGNSARPTTPTWYVSESENGGYYARGYDPTLPNTAPSNDPNKPHRINPYQDEVKMPYISALDSYVAYAQEVDGTLKGGVSYKLDANGNVTQSPLGTINAHYNGVGPSGDANLSDKGALVLEGTAANPIEIKGPVVIDSDVVIRGYVKGQGTIYSGRNIHIVGSIQYVDPPSWSHPDRNPKNTEAINAEKNFLGLAAKGNIVMGDYTLSSWLGSSSSGLQYYMKNGPYVQQYICDASDNTIGYPRTIEYGWTSNESRFCGDYTQKDGGKKVDVSTKTEYVYENGRRVQKTTTTISDKQERRYYQSVCAEKLIQHLCADSQSSRGAYQPTITRIDAVMYNNHGIIGHIGNCTINGSLVCRNEAMIYEGALKINWDHRLYSGIKGITGLPMDASQPPKTLSWREISNND